MSLTEFQKRTVKHAFDSLVQQSKEKKNARFLIADEVGLGKTIVAKEVIRNFLNRTEKQEFTVVYICNNQLLAKKNLKKLNPLLPDDKNWESNIPPVSRLSLFPLEKFSSDKKREKNKEKKRICNFFALTPGTSLSLTHGSGTVLERRLLYYLAQEDQPALKEYQQKIIQGWNFLDYFFQHNSDILKNILEKVKGSACKDLCRRIESAADIPGKRQLLSQFGASLLNPDLVIFDEFQNYEQIFINDGISYQSQQEQGEFRKEIDIINNVFANLAEPPKYLLLSATPFESLTMSEQLARGEVTLSSCKAFCRLISWLNPDDKTFTEKWEKYGEHFKEYCEALKHDQKADDIPVKQALQSVQESVTKVMCRTERPFEHLKKLVNGIDLKNSVLKGINCKKQLCFSDHQELAEFEKYVLSPLSAMGAEYVTFKNFIKKHRNFYNFFLPEISDSMKSPYMQNLHRIMAGPDEKLRPLLWIPPTKPTLELENAFKTAADDGYSKVLIFSQYRFIPRMISAGFSEKFERDYYAENKSVEYKFFDSRIFREAARSLLDPLPTDDLNQIFSSPAKSIYWAFKKLLRDAFHDQNLNKHCRLWSVILAVSLVKYMLHSANLPCIEAVAGTEGSKEFKAAEYCRKGCFADAAYEYMFLLSRENHGIWTLEKIDSIARQFYSVLHLKTNNLKLYTQKKRENPFGGDENPEEKYAQRVRTHFADCFSEKERETVNQNTEEPQKSESSQNNEKRTPIQTLADILQNILPEISGYSLDELLPREQPDRNRELQSAFNSMFKPFILSTTSVGQEGLDFHWYCRKIMHWNLPSNPVDFDQREGRINRYGSFALRQSLAEHYSSNDFSWETFWEDQKERAGKRNACGMVPFWLPPEDNESHRKIERIIPFYPLSREHLFIDDLLKMQAVYRMVIGQPHQDELLSLLRELSEENRKKVMQYTLSLAPKQETH